MIVLPCKNNFFLFLEISQKSWFFHQIQWLYNNMWNLYHKMHKNLLDDEHARGSHVSQVCLPTRRSIQKGAVQRIHQVWSPMWLSGLAPSPAPCWWTGITEGCHATVVINYWIFINIWTSRTHLYTYTIPFLLCYNEWI